MWQSKLNMSLKRVAVIVIAGVLILTLGALSAFAAVVAPGNVLVVKHAEEKGKHSENAGATWHEGGTKDSHVNRGKKEGSRLWVKREEATTGGNALVVKHAEEKGKHSEAGSTTLHETTRDNNHVTSGGEKSTHSPAKEKNHREEGQQEAHSAGHTKTE